MTIWYDFTTTRRNQSRNGIANVEWSIGMALIEHCAAEVRGFALDERSGLCEIDPARDLVNTPYGQGRQTTVLPGPDARGLRRAIRRALATIVGPNVADVERWMSSALARSRRCRARWRSAVARSLPPTRSAPRIVNRVKQDDVVISMGADWSGELARQLGELRRATRCRVVTMVYDLIPLTHTHLAFHDEPAMFAEYYRRLLTVSDLVTCISKQSRDDLFQFVQENGISAPSIEVLRLGDGDHQPDLQRTDRADFYLMVGTVERRKNVELVYDALRILESKGAAVPTVVVAGSAGWGVDDFLSEIRVATSAASRSMVLLGAVEDEDLASMYQRARALLFPSHYEGWGLPLREAAVRGCPIAAGDCAAAREAVGSYAGAVMLCSDDAGPWADYMARIPPPVEPVEFRSWSESVTDLLSLIDARVGSHGRSRR